MFDGGSQHGYSVCGSISPSGFGWRYPCIRCKHSGRYFLSLVSATINFFSVSLC